MLKIFQYMTLMLGTLQPALIFSQELPDTFISPRSKATGGAFTAIANDESAVWTNPAGISRILKARSRGDSSFVKIPGLVMGANTKSTSFVTQLSQVASGVSQIGQHADELNQQPFWAYSGAFPMGLFKLNNTPFLAGIYSSNTLSSMIDSQDITRADTRVTSDLGLLFGTAYAHPSNRLSLGLTIRYLTRYGYEDRIPLSSLSDPKLLNDAVREGANRSSALAYDLGFLWTLADFWFPTFGVAILNGPSACKDDYLNPYSKVRERVCGTKFRGELANPEALSTMDPTDIRIGLSVTPRFGRSFAARIALDIHQLPTKIGSSVYGLSNVDLSKKLHAGIEFFTGNPLLPPPFVIGLGIGQGFYSYGVVTRISQLSIEFASYGKDISTDSSPLEDRRYLAGLSLTW